MENLEKFYSLLNKFYDSHIFREVYNKDGTLICNVYEQFYAVFNLDVIKLSENDLTGFVMNIDNVRRLVEDPAYIKDYYESMDLEELKKLLIVFDENFLKKMLEKRQAFENLPPSKAVDLEFEENLKQKNR